MKPCLHAVLGLDHGVVVVLGDEAFALLLLYSNLFIQNLHMFKLEFIHALSRLKEFLVLADVVLHSLLFEVSLRLPAYVKVDTDASSVLCFEAEAIHYVGAARLIEVARPYQFLEAEDPHGATQEKAVDLTHQGAPGAPGVHLQLMIAGFNGQPQETVSLYAVSPPIIH